MDQIYQCRCTEEKRMRYEARSGRISADWKTGAGRKQEGEIGRQEGRQVYKETGIQEGTVVWEMKEGLKIGRQEGRQKGLQEGKNSGGPQEGRQEGQQEGIQVVVELLREMGMEKEIVCVKIQEKFQFSLSDAAKEVEKYWKS